MLLWQRDAQLHHTDVLYPQLWIALHVDGLRRVSRHTKCIASGAIYSGFAKMNGDAASS